MNDDRTGVTVMLPREQRAWLLREAADRAAESGGRASVSRVVRELVEQAQASKAGEAA